MTNPPASPAMQAQALLDQARRHLDATLGHLMQAMPGDVQADLIAWAHAAGIVAQGLLLLGNTAGRSAQQIAEEMQRVLESGRHRQPTGGFAPIPTVPPPAGTPAPHTLKRDRWGRSQPDPHQQWRKPGA